MAGMKSSTMMLMMIMFIVASVHMQTSMAQTRHVVGDALGWTIPTGPAYTTWASQQTFTVGDTLFFNFTTGIHNVAEVSQAAYGPCTTANPISIATTGPATITLTTAGTHYYICTVGTHCQIGQKLTINVSAPATPPPASAPATPPTATPTPTPQPTPVSPPTTTPSTAPVPSATTPAQSPVGASPPMPTTSGPSPPSDRTTPSPAGATTPPPPSPSTAARSFIAVVPTTFLAVALAFFY